MCQCVKVNVVLEISRCTVEDTLFMWSNRLHWWCANALSRIAFSTIQCTSRIRGKRFKREWGLNRDVQTMWRAAYIFASFAYFKRRIIIWCYSTSLHSGGLAGTKWVWDHGVSIYIECCNSIGYICKVGDKWVVVVQRCHSLCRSSSCSSLAEFHLGVNDGFTKRVPVGIHLTSTIQLMQSHTQWLSLYELYR